MRIDSHQHFWDLSRSGYDWLTPDLEALYRNYQPKDLEPILQRERITGTVLVQASGTIEETHYLLSIAAQTPFVLGVVGWVDLASPKAPEQLRQLKANSYLKGIRPMLQNIEQDDWILMDEVKPSLDEMTQLGLTFDALITSRHLEIIKEFTANNPKLKIVIDHAAKPNFCSDSFEVWASAMLALSKNENVYCKLSGLWTETSGDITDANIRPYVHHLANCFGSKKIMWGSDWPVLNMTGEYSAWLIQAQRLLGEMPTIEIEDCFGNTAEHFYGL